MLMQPGAKIEARPHSMKFRPAPLKGLDLATPISMLKEGFALRLDNWICRDDGLHVRDGWGAHRLGIPAAIARLIPHKAKVYAATASAIYDVWTPKLTGLSNGNWHFAEMVNGAGTFTAMVNGADGLVVTDGTSVEVKTITGATASSFDRVHWHHNRLWLAGNDLEPYYLDMDAIAGPAYPFPIAQLCRKGGRVQAFATITQDGARSGNDQLAIMTSEGELLIYAGNDPDNAGSFGVVGVWDVGKPLGARCFAEHGGNVVVLTERGLLPIPANLGTPERQLSKTALSDPIETMLDTRRAQTLTADWQVISSPDHGLLLITDGSTYQYVLSDTGGWSRFVGLGGAHWTVAGNELYFATGTTVARYGGHMDRDQAIPSYFVEAFSRLGSAQYKQARRFRPHYKAAHPYKPRVELLTDEREPTDPFTAANLDDVHTLWPDLDLWGTALDWSGPMSSRVNAWRSINGRGFTLAAAVGMKTRAPIVYTGHDITFESGGLYP